MVLRISRRGARRPSRSTACLVPALLVLLFAYGILGTLLLGIGSASSKASTSAGASWVYPNQPVQRGLAPLDTVTASPSPTPPCAFTWSSVLEFGNVDFRKVSVLSASDAWAAGDQGNAARVAHWNGTTWDLVSVPNIGQYGNWLTSVAARSSDDVWAAGYYRDSAGGLSNGLVEHWDGTQWTAARLRSTYNHGEHIEDLAAPAPDDVWAIGAYIDTTGTVQRGLTAHWDGSSWSMVPNPSPEDSQLDGIAALTPNNIWAVGYQVAGGGHQMLIEHWDGQGWGLVPGPSIPVATRLRSISAISATDIWAVGEYPGLNPSTLALHWDGVRWTIVPTPNFSALDNRLSGVAAISARDVWAVGSYEDPDPNIGARMLLLHWDGQTWSVAPGANYGSDSYVLDVAASAPGNVHAAGSTYPDRHGPGARILRYSGLCVTFTSTSTPTQTGTNTPTSTNTPTRLTDTPTSTYTPSNTPTYTHTPTPTPTFTPTLTITHTPTSTNTSSYTPTNTRTPPPTLTSVRPPCYYGPTSSSTSCTDPHSYRYNFQYSGGPRWPTGQSVVHFEIANDPGGPWIELQQQQLSNPANAGTFIVNNIPPQFTWYRIWFTFSGWCIPNWYETQGEVKPYHLCFPSAVTPVPTPTTTNTPSPSPTHTPCPMTFRDVQSTDYFYEPVRSLYCRGVISGYWDNTFRPYDNTTRGQLARIVVLGFGTPIYMPSTPTFNDVPSSYVFYQHIETAYHSNLVSGYDCGGPGEPCPGLYFRPGNLVTRGQLCKIVVLAAGWSLLDPSTPTFRDVPVGSTFFRYVETAYSHGIISGYTCGTGCLEFRPGNNSTRGQICKIVYLAITQPGP